MDKLKDIIYDYTDLILSLLVVLVIVFIIGTNFTYFDQDLSSFIGASDNGTSADKKSPVSSDQNDGSENTTASESTEEKMAEEEPSPSDESETIKIEITQGSTASQIGDTLQTHDLVNSSSEFVEATESFNVSHRLRPGTFEIPLDSSLREIIQILIQSSL